MNEIELHGVYGTPPGELVEVPPAAIQFSPLVPGSRRFEEFGGKLASVAMLAPPGTIERRHELALAIQALAPGGRLTALAPKDKGGARIAQEFKSFGLDVAETSQRHHRICSATRPAELHGIDAAIDAGGPRIVEALGFWSQPGVFAWDRIDPGSALLLGHLPALEGRGADFGCGIGILSRAVLNSALVEALTLVDIDRRAIDAAHHNILDARADFLWSNIRNEGAMPAGLDFIVMNPPFHDGGGEDRSLGQAFVRQAAQRLRKGGRLWVTANRHLPYEESLKQHFAHVRLVAETGGYKVYEARK